MQCLFGGSECLVCRDFVLQISEVTVGDEKLLLREFGFAKVDYLIAPVDYQIDLCAVTAASIGLLIESIG